MFAGNVDEDLFDPSASSNLAALFGTKMTFKNDDANLSYTAPKQPKSERQETTISSKPTAQSKVLCSKFVNAFKQVGESYVGEGKCGIAIIGNESLNVYELILYKSNQEIISRSKLGVDFIFKVQNDNFASFSSDQQEYWSVHFDGDEHETFITHLESYKVRIVRPAAISKPDSDSSVKASILCRMAKMGQSILPNSPKTVNSESDDSDAVPKRLKRKPKRANASENCSSPETALVNSRPIPQPVQNQFVQMPQTPDMFNIFLAENRTHNCEMRMNMMQIFNKLDKIADGITQSKTTHSQVNQRDPGYDDLLNKTKQYESTLRENSDEIDRLTRENAEYKDAVAKLELKITNLESAAKESDRLLKVIEEHVKTNKELENKQVEQQIEIKRLTQLCKGNGEAVEDLSAKLSDCVIKQELFPTRLKQNMNTLYKSLMDSFENEEETYSAPQIQQILATHLRAATSIIIKDFCNNFDIKEREF